MMQRVAIVLAWSLLLGPARADAQLTIDVVGGEGRQIPISIASFAGDELREAEHPMRPIIAQDLAHSGWFRVVGSDSAVGVDELAAHYARLKAEGAQVALGGTVSENNGMVETHFELHDVGKRTRLLGERYAARPQRQRHTAHRIADLVQETLTGKRGASATRICYVARDNQRSELVVADADGFNPTVIYSALGPIVAPQWSPDGQHIVYVSLENKKPVVYVHHLADASRSLIARFRGSNFSPAWSPDGRRLALALSKEGGSQIYLMNADGSDLQHLINSRSRDSEPTFAPDGRRLLFSSDRSGSPQIYELQLDGADAPKRLTLDGSYNTSPRYSPDGRAFAFVHYQDGRFNIAIQDIDGGQMRVLSTGHDDRSPSFAPNGYALLYSTETKGRAILSAVTTDGRVKWTIPTGNDSISTPAWGPFNTSYSGD